MLCDCANLTQSKKGGGALIVVSIETHLGALLVGLCVNNRIQRYSDPKHSAILWVLFSKSPNILWTLKNGGVNPKVLARIQWFHPCKFFHSCHYFSGTRNFSLTSFSKAPVYMGEAAVFLTSSVSLVVLRRLGKFVLGTKLFWRTII